MIHKPVYREIFILSRLRVFDEICDDSGYSFRPEDNVWDFVREIVSRNIGSTKMLVEEQINEIFR